MKQEELQCILERFLNIPIESGDRVFDAFAQLPGAVYKNGSACYCTYACL